MNPTVVVSGDTDSMLIAVSSRNEIDMIKPDKLVEWREDRKHFIADLSIATQKREPGLWKLESTYMKCP
jgi:hypothetical protein